MSENAEIDQTSLLDDTVSRLTTIIELAPTAIVMVNQSGLMVLVNRAVELLFGYSRAELLGRPIDVLTPARFRERHPLLRADFFKNPQARPMGAGRDLYGLRKDGSEFPVEIGLNPIDTEQGSLVLSAIIDLTERKRSADLFRATIEAAPMAMIMIDPEGRIVLANAEAVRLFGYSQIELLGQPVEILVPTRFSQHHPGLRLDFFGQPQARPMGAGRDLYGLRKDGSEFPVEIGLNPVKTEHGAFVLSAVVDITERKQLEARLRNMNEELEKRVAERAAELARANEALERSNLELQQFAYIASHDLQAPLRSISGFAQLLQQDYAGKLDVQADEWIRRTVENAQHMQTLIRDLLTYSRVDSMARPFEPVDCAAVFDDAVAMLEASIHDLNAGVTRNPLPTVMGDRSQLVQLFMNLIGNGIKYHGDEPPHVQVDAKKIDQAWLFSVCDNGIGIEPKHHERIFEIFRRLHTQQSYPGTGIGLAVCRRVVHRHSGRIWVESEPGRGSAFYFTIAEGEVAD